MGLLSLGILFGLMSMLGYGTYQFFINRSVKNINIYSSLIFVHLFLVLFTIPLLFFYEPMVPNLKIGLLIVLTSFIGAVNIPFLYKAIKKGKLSLVIPIANTYSLFAVIFSALLFGEKLRFSQYFFGLMILIGVFFIVARRYELKNMKIDRRDIRPIMYALIFSCGLGIYSVLLKPIERSVGPIYGSFYTEFLILVFLGLYYFSYVVELQRPKSNIWKFLILAGFFQAIGVIFFFFGIKHSNVSITSIIGAGNPLIAIVFAFVFLKERIEWNQLLGILITLIGLIGIAL